MQRPRLTTIVLDELDDLIDAVTDAMRDDRIDEHERQRIRKEAAEARTAADKADLNIAYALSVAHNGADSRRSRDLATDYQDTYGNVVHLNTRKRRQECPPTGAA